MFRLPEITYPLSIDTIGKSIATGHELVVWCNDCRHDARVNQVQLGRRLGLEHSCLAQDLKRYFYCPKCRAAGRPGKDVSFICEAPTYPTSNWPRKDPHGKSHGA